MQRAAEEYAEEDKQKAEDIETRNRADQLVYSVEKALSDLGEKVSQDERGKIEDQLRRLKDKLSQNAPIEEIRQATEELSKSSQHLAEDAYKQTTSTAGSGETETSSGEGEEDGGDYIDAEYDDKE